MSGKRSKQIRRAVKHALRDDGKTLFNRLCDMSFKARFSTCWRIMRKQKV